MDTFGTERYGGVELETALRGLVKSKRACARLRMSLGLKLSTLAIKTLADNTLEGDLRDAVYSFFKDEIFNESHPVWNGLLIDPNDEDNPDSQFPISIREYEGVFYVWAPEYGPRGYFLKRSDAEMFISCNWDSDCVRPE